MPKVSICRTPPRIPEVHLPEEPFLQVAAALRIEINRGFVVLRDIVTGRDLKEFLIVRILCFFKKSLHSILAQHLKFFIGSAIPIC